MDVTPLVVTAVDAETAFIAVNLIPFMKISITDNVRSFTQLTDHFTM